MQLHHKTQRNTPWPHVFTSLAPLCLIFLASFFLNDCFFYEIFSYPEVKLTNERFNCFASLCDFEMSFFFRPEVKSEPQRQSPTEDDEREDLNSSAEIRDPVKYEEIFQPKHKLGELVLDIRYCTLSHITGISLTLFMLQLLSWICNSGTSKYRSSNWFVRAWWTIG